MLGVPETTTRSLYETKYFSKTQRNGKFWSQCLRSSSCHTTPSYGCGKQRNSIHGNCGSNGDSRINGLFFRKITEEIGLKHINESLALHDPVLLSAGFFMHQTPLLRFSQPDPLLIWSRFLRT